MVSNSLFEIHSKNSNCWCIWCSLWQSLESQLIRCTFWSTCSKIWKYHYCEFNWQKERSINDRRRIRKRMYSIVWIDESCDSSNNYKNVLNFNWFDFHAECKGMHYENISKLLAMTNESVTNAGYFEAIGFWLDFSKWTWKPRQLSPNKQL